MVLVDSDNVELGQEDDSGRVPDVSVVVLAYNHETTLAECLDGILKQKFDGVLEVLIGLNESTDDTDIIAEHVAGKHEGWRTVLTSRDETQHVLGSPTGSSNLFHCLQYVRGKYVTLIEADDYWIREDKIQIQFDMMENHPLWSGVMMPVAMMKEDGTVLGFNCMAQARRLAMFKGDLITEECLIEYGNCIHVLGFMFRSSMVTLNSLHQRSPALDHVIALICSRRGPIGYVHESPVGVYRSFGGTFSSLTARENGLKSALKWMVLAQIVDGTLAEKAMLKADGILTDLNDAESKLKKGRAVMWIGRLRRAFRAISNQ